MLTKIKVSILGKEYMLQTEEPPSYVYGLARQLEANLKDAMEKGVSQYTAAIMAALSAMDDLTRQKRQLDQTADMTKDYVDDAGRVRIERDAAYKEIEALRSRIAQLENILKLRKIAESAQNGTKNA